MTISSPRPRSPGARSWTEGFTLVEVLVAFAILAILMIAVQRGVSAGILGIREANTRVRAERVARTLIDGPLGSGPDAVAPRRGRMDGIAWAIRFEPLALPVEQMSSAASNPARWTPLTMIVEVSGDGSRPFVVEVVRLVRLAPR